jgi:hypothetical protein
MSRSTQCAANLLSIGIISSDTTDNRLYYEVNQKYDFYPPLSAIFGAGGVKKEATKAGASSVTIDGPDDDIKALGNVDYAIYTGQFTRDESAGTDILIVGDVNQTKLGKYIASLEEKEGKELRFTVMTPSEFNYRKEVKDRFLSDVLAAKKQVIIDKSASANKKEKE